MTMPNDHEHAGCGEVQKLRTTDPMERIIEAALIDAGIRYETDMGGGIPEALDFKLPDHGIFIEVKRMHSDRIAAQMARAPNVIAAQGVEAVRFLADAIRIASVAALTAEVERLRGALVQASNALEPLVSAPVLDGPDGRHSKARDARYRAIRALAGEGV